MSRAKGGSRGGIPPRERNSAHKAAQARGLVDNQRGELGEAAFIHKAMSLGFMVAEPRGHNLPYDFIVEGGSGFRSVQIKACANLRRGLYQTCISCRRHRIVDVWPGRRLGRAKRSQAVLALHRCPYASRLYSSKRKETSVSS